MTEIITVQRCNYQVMTRASHTGWRRCRRMGKPVTVANGGQTVSIHLCLKCCERVQAEADLAKRP